MRGDLAMNVAMEAGYKKPICSICLADKPDLVSQITTYHLFIKVKAHMDIFKEGLELFGVYQYVSKYQSLLRSLFVDESIPLTASRSLCVCVCVCVCNQPHYRPSVDDILSTIGA